ncbi:MAG: OFA family MFS transporter [Candidatus Dadabacteria bacterium]|nr:OFA family MFS transporter [Candidatus Dadabacteria bacterium]MYC40379.1 OFA family MFS transporter [Candidatus Dadabacteria bacterium]
MASLLSKERIVRGPEFNRWLAVPPSIAIHLCIGSVYAWSIYNPALIEVLGVATSAADDWTLRQVVWIFSVAIAFTGLTAAFAGKWVEKVGPRMVCVMAACFWGGGYMLSSLGVTLHQLWLIYLGYGVIGGIGLGLGYVSPVTNLIRWFPDRRGLAAGMAIMGFGGGAMIAVPLKEFFLQYFYKAPQYLGTADALDMITHSGRRFVEVGGQLKEVVVAGAAEAAHVLAPGTEAAGVYVVGTGSAGVAQTFLFFGAVYFLVIMVSAFLYRVPVPGYKPQGWEPPIGKDSSKRMISQKDVHMDQALKTPQFYQVWVVLCLNVTAGIGIISVAKTMMTEIFSNALPDIVDVTFAATYVLMIGMFNMLGRVMWASASDKLGRRNTCSIFCAAGFLLYLSIPVAAHYVNLNPSIFWLLMFYAATMIIFTFYGGVFATVPAYLADLFGTRYVGGIYGRLLTAWSVAGVLGPLAVTSLRDRSLMAEINRLAEKVSPDEFVRTFGAGVSDLEILVQNKTVTLAKLMDIAPEGTVDPTASLYNSTMYVMAALLIIALISNLLIKPVHEKHHIKD